MTTPHVVSVPQTLDPEGTAYSLARLSRSADPYEEIVASLTQETTAAFIDRFVLKYGHASVKEMAIVGQVISGVSMWAAMQLEQDPLWCGQERSSRYQDFGEQEDPPYYDPWTGVGVTDLNTSTPARHTAYHDAIRASYANYRTALEVTRRALQDTWRVTSNSEHRALESRVHDIARLFLPLATLTTVGQLISARTLERQLSRLARRDTSELSHIAREIYANAMDQLPHLGGGLRVSVSPSSSQLAKLAGEIFAEVTPRHPEPSPAAFRMQETLVDVLHIESEETEILATVLYQYTAEPSYRRFADCVSVVENLPPSARSHFMTQLRALTGLPDQHTTLPHWLQGRSPYIVDAVMDIGSLRDFNRHRPVTHLHTPLEFLLHDYAEDGTFLPQKTVEHLDKKQLFRYLPSGVPHSNPLGTAWGQLRTLWVGHLDMVAQALHRVSPAHHYYLIPLGAGVRHAMKGTLEQFRYIAHLRAGPAGHFLYREVAQQMAATFRKQQPYYASYFNVNTAPSWDREVLLAR